MEVDKTEEESIFEDLQEIRDDGRFLIQLEIPVKLTTLFRSKLTTFLSGEKVIKLSGEV